MERRFTANWPASLILLLGLVALVNHADAEVSAVPVGVILDLTSVTGTRFHTSIQMALEDYYSANPNSTTRIELHFRDSSSDAVGAVSAGKSIVH